MFSAEMWLALSHPIVVAMLGSTILMIWRHDTQRPKYLLYFGMAYLVYAIGVTCQITGIPHTRAINVLLSGGLYMIAVVLLTQGMTALSDRNYTYWWPVLIISIMLVGRLYFLFIEDNPKIRFYLLHFSVSAVLLHGAYLTRNLLKGRPVEKILYVSFLLLGLSNAPRSLLAFSRPDDSYGFDLSIYWLITKVSIYVFSVAFGLSLIITVMQRRITTHRLLSETDALTGLRNRRGFYETATRMISRVDTYTVLVADIDRFKVVNDTYGHAVGDIVLEDTAKIIESCIRPLDISGRIGGEEFAIFLPNTSLVEGHKVAERLRQTFENYVFAKGRGDLRCTISLGVATFDNTVSLIEATSRADKMLYQAKQQGRNRVMSGHPTHRGRAS